jgi:hypothetical protein
VPLYPTQVLARDVNAHALLRHNLTIDRSDMGVGKTFHGIATANALKLRPFFISPLAVHNDIRKAFGLTETEGAVTNYEHLRTDGCTHVKKKADGSYEWNVPGNTLLIYDEAQGLCNDTQNGAIALAAHRQGIPIMAMSATLAHSPLDFFTLGQMMGLHKGKDFEKWTLKFGAYLGTTRINGKVEPAVKFDPLSYSGRRGLASLGKIIDGDWGCRISQKQFGGFPTSTMTPRIIEGGEAAAMIQRAYDEISAPMAEIDKKMTVAEKQAAIVQRIRLRQQIEMAKMPLLADLIRENVAAGYSVTAFLTHSESIDQLKLLITDLLPGEISGKISQKHRDAAKDAFQRDEIRVMLVQIKAGGAGLSLHDLTGKHKRKGFLLPDDSIRAIVQASGRLPRAGAKSNSEYEFIFLADTVEERICMSLIAKARGLSIFNDGSGLGCLDDLMDLRMGG